MKTKILCIALAVLLVGTALGFAIYNKVGTTYDYASEDMSEYLTLSKEDIETLWESVKGDIDPHRDATEKDVDYAIAALLKAVSSKSEDTLTAGTLHKFDYLTMVYGMYLDGKLVTKPTSLDITTKENWTTLQLHEDSELSKLLSDALVGKDISSFEVYTNGDVYDGDTLWVSYTVTEEDGTTADYKFQKTTLATMDDDFGIPLMNFNFTQQKATIVSEAKDAGELPQVIGETFEFICEGKTISMTVKFASRAIVTAGKPQTDDTLYFTYKKDGDSEATPFVITVNDAGKEMIGKIEGLKDTIFYDELINLEVSDATQTIEWEVPATEEGATATPVKYSVTLEYIIPAINDPEREGYQAADAYISLPGIVISEDSKLVEVGADDKDVTDADDKTISLAGKTVEVRIYPINYVDAGYGSFDTLYDVLDETLADNTADIADASITSYIKERVVINYLNAWANYVEANEALKDAGEDTEKVDEAETALDDAILALRAAETAYYEYENENRAEGADEIIDPDTDDLTEKKEEEVFAEAYKLYRKATKDSKQATYSQEYRIAVAKVVWEKLIEQYADKMTEFPSKAIRLVKRGWIDSQEATLYSKGSFTVGTETVTPSDVDDYLTRVVFVDEVAEGKDVDDLVDAAVKEIVSQNVLLYRLAEIYEITLTEEQIDNIAYVENFYGQYPSLDRYGMAQLGSPLLSKSEAAYLFDGVMAAMTEELDENVVKTEAPEVDAEEAPQA